MLEKFSFIENAIRTRVNSFFGKLNGRKDHSTQLFEFHYFEEEEIDMTTQFLQIYFEFDVNTLLVFGFNSLKCESNLIKFYLLPYLIH